MCVMSGIKCRVFTLQSLLVSFQLFLDPDILVQQAVEDLLGEEPISEQAKAMNDSAQVMLGWINDPQNKAACTGFCEHLVKFTEPCTTSVQHQPTIEHRCGRSF